MVKLSVTLLNILNGHLDKDLLSCPKLVKEKKNTLLGKNDLFP